MKGAGPQQGSPVRYVIGMVALLGIGISLIIWELSVRHNIRH